MINSVIDISHHQGPNIDFGKVKAAGVVGVIHKGTGGTNFKDNMYSVNRQRALAAGLLWGAYHWGTGDADGAAQAQYSLITPSPTIKRYSRWTTNQTYLAHIAWGRI